MKNATDIREEQWCEKVSDVSELPSHISGSVLRAEIDFLYGEYIASY